MADECPYLEYRPLADDGNDAERAYCTASGEFVQAMRADICNDRYGLDHETDCEIYRDHEGLPDVPGVDADDPADGVGGS
ncbi:hypothetical protein [Halorussus litoreus]|uniref:hypothetical protein n=1 Tax=Halorussus litoreus TaxID=1710536 RepID=UPI000E222A67|nr:hypothetical protein [Halorussus litoreus]